LLGADFLFLITRIYACLLSHAFRRSSFRSGTTPHQLFHGTARVIHMVRLRIKRSVSQSWSPAGCRYDPQYRRGVAEITEPGPTARGSVGSVVAIEPPMRAQTTAKAAKGRIHPEPTNALLPACRDASRICS